MIKNILSVDFESFFYLPTHTPNNKNNRKIYDEYITATGKELLDLLEKHKTKLTFFVLGELFEQYPELIEEINDSGHEIAYHTHKHKLLKNKNILLESLHESKKFIKKFKPNGFRAPKMFMKEEYFPILKKNGFKYDSSVYYQKSYDKINGIWELPISSINYFKKQDIIFPNPLGFKNLLKEMPFGSGYFLGIYQSNIDFFISKYNKKNKQANLFIHNWQILKQKTISDHNYNYIFSHPTYLHHLPYMVNLKKTMEHMLKNFKFCTCNEFVETI